MILMKFLACHISEESKQTEQINNIESEISEKGTTSFGNELTAPQVLGSKPARTTALIVIDTLRDDALWKAHTPNIDALSINGTRVKHAWAASTWTVPSVIGLLTGKSVREHGWNLPTGRIGKYPPLPDTQLVTEFFFDNDIKSIGIHANPYLAEELGFSRGFESWTKSMDPAFPRILKAQLTAHGWNQETRGFIYLHFIGPHSPLNPSETAKNKYQLEDHWFEERNGLQIGAAKRNQIKGVRDAYHAAYHAVIEDTDTLVGECLDILKEYDPDIRIVLTSDHGELLGEHNIVGHGSHLYEPLTHVPLIVSHGEYPDFTSNTCVANWLSQQYGLNWPSSKSCEGNTLISQRESDFAILFPDMDKYVQNKSGLNKTNLITDIEESLYIPSTDDMILPILNAIPLNPPPENMTELPDATREQLRELGYVE